MPTKLESPYVCLFDEATDEGLSLPESIQEDYGGDWVLPVGDDSTYAYSNFVLSHDGRISFNEPGHLGGGDVSGFNQHDTWLMALLRARADAVMVGDNTLRLEPEHVWTHQYIFPDTTEIFDSLRSSEQRATFPLQVFLSIDGNINWDAAVFASPDYHSIIATTQEGAARVKSDARSRGTVDVIAQEGSSVDIAKLVVTLRRDFGVHSLLIEGGPRAYGSAVKDGVIVDEFLTWSPIVVGSDNSEGRFRPCLLDGIAYTPDNAVRMVPLSVRRSGDYLFLRSRYTDTGT